MWPIFILHFVLQTDHFLRPHIFFDIFQEHLTHICQKFFVPGTILIGIVRFKLVFLLLFDRTDWTFVDVLDIFLGLVLICDVVNIVQRSESVVGYWYLSFDPPGSVFGYFGFLFRGHDNGRQFVVLLFLFFCFDESLQKNLLESKIVNDGSVNFGPFLKLNEFGIKGELLDNPEQRKFILDFEFDRGVNEHLQDLMIVECGFVLFLGFEIVHFDLFVIRHSRRVNWFVKVKKFMRNLMADFDLLKLASFQR